jgi:hypothetical protein
MDEMSLPSSHGRLANYAAESNVHGRAFDDFVAIGSRRCGSSATAVRFGAPGGEIL